MKILLDTADVKTIEAILPFYPIAGVTTNPSILAKDSADVKATLLKIREVLGNERELHIQTTATVAEEMLAQAKKMKATFGANFCIKIPINEQGLKAITLCRNAGINVTATAIFTPMQALMAAMAGASYVAPYVDRLDNIIANGVDVVAQISELFEIHNMETEILAASFKNVQQIYDVAANGAQAATINGELCKKLLFHPYTDKSLKDFESDWKKKFGAAEITDLLK